METVMAVQPKRESDSDKAYWDFVEKTAAEVNSWPAWMKGQYTSVTTPTTNESNSSNSGSNDRS